MARALRRIWNPAIYQGGRAHARYFEGWYFKQVNAEESRVLSVIPGVSHSPDGSVHHAFVQVVPSGGVARYYAYPIEEFSWDPSSRFSIGIGPNTFSRDGFSLDLQDESSAVSGQVRFGEWSPWPVTTFAPGIMGWYRFVPGMETYHGVLSMDHGLSGAVSIDGEPLLLDGGRGYIEKDWGRSFPSSWIWAQSNNFERVGISLTLSVAKVPWMTGAFVGSVAGLLLDGRLHRFTTYTGAKPRCIETSGNDARVVLADVREELEVVLTGCEALDLKAPVLGAMEGHDAESLGGSAHVTLRGIRGGRVNTLFTGTGVQAGIEIMNDAGELGSGLRSDAGVSGG